MWTWNGTELFKNNTIVYTLGFRIQQKGCIQHFEGKIISNLKFHTQTNDPSSCMMEKRNLQTEKISLN